MTLALIMPYVMVDILSPCGSSHMPSDTTEGVQGEGEVGVMMVGGEGNTAEDIYTDDSSWRWGT